MTKAEIERYLELDHEKHWSVDEQEEFYRLEALWEAFDPETVERERAESRELAQAMFHSYEALIGKHDTPERRALLADNPWLLDMAPDTVAAIEARIQAMTGGRR